MDTRSEGSQYTGKYEKDFPEWVHDIKVSYTAYYQVRKNTERRLGVPTVDGGEIEEQLVTKYTQGFYDLISHVKAELPEAIQYRKARAAHLSLQTNVGDINLSVNDEDLYYLPKTDEVLRVSRDAEQRFRPDSPEFVGWDVLHDNRQVLPPLSIQLIKLTHDARQAWGELSPDAITTIVEEIEELVQDKPEMQYIEKFHDLQDSLQEEGDSTTEEEARELGLQMQRRIVNLVNTLSQYPQLFNKIPKVIEAGRKWVEDEEGRLVTSEMQPYFRKEEKDLVLAPLIRRKNWLGRVKEEPDLSKAVAAEPEDWLGTGLLMQVLLSPIPPEYRDFLEDPQGYEVRRGLSEENHKK